LCELLTFGTFIVASTVFVVLTGVAYCVVWLTTKEQQRKTTQENVRGTRKSNGQRECPRKMLKICLIASGWRSFALNNNKRKTLYKMASIKMGGGVVQGVVQWVWVVRWVVLTISIGICPTQSAHPCPRGRIR